MQETMVALASITVQFGRPQENLSVMLDWIKQAAQKGADLVCFPEVAVQGYHTDVDLMRKQAEPINGSICSRLVEAAQEHGLAISTGMALRVDEKVYNAQVFLGPRGPLGYAAKVHVCQNEENAFDAGDAWRTIDLGFAKVGTVICFDAEFPEAARCLALEGAEIILMSFATGRCDSCGRPQDPRAWADEVLRWAPARAYENRAFVIAVNHAGDVEDKDHVCGTSWVEPGGTHHWPGYSFAIDPSGEMIVQSVRNRTDQRLLMVRLDPKVRDYWRVGGGDFLAERRPDTYTRLVAR